MIYKKSCVHGAVLTALLFAISTACYSEQPVYDLKSLYDSHQWFELRRAVNATPASNFYRGAVESVFNRTVLAQQHLKKVIESAPNSEDAYRAHDLLTSLYLRSGKYRAALIQNERMLAKRPNQGDAPELHGLLSTLGSYPNQVVTQRISSKVRYRMLNGNMLIPVRIGSNKAEYILDTAASLSTITESEARRLNLKVHGSNASAETATGAELSIRIAVASHLSVGDFHLANVAFVVVPDEQQPFANLPPGQKGIIGLPVLLAFQTIRWRQEGTLEIAFPNHNSNGSPNLCFEDIGLIAEVKVLHHQITVALDTGANHSQLWPLFAKAFPEVIKQGKYDTVQINGMAGAMQYPVILVPEVKLTIGGKPFDMRPAIVLLRQDADLAKWYQGDIGWDILGLGETTMDFKSMSLSLE